MENNLNLGFLPDSAPSPRVEEHLTLADRQKDSLLAGWMHMVSLYPLTGWFRYPCESRASRGKPDVNKVMNLVGGNPYLSLSLHRL